MFGGYYTNDNDIIIFELGDEVKRKSDGKIGILTDATGSDLYEIEFSDGSIDHISEDHFDLIIIDPFLDELYDTSIQNRDLSDRITHMLVITKAKKHIEKLKRLNYSIPFMNHMIVYPNCCVIELGRNLDYKKSL